VHSVETVVLSHIAQFGTPRISWLTKQAGKQEADNDEERECAEHGDRLPTGRKSVKWVDPLDEFIGVHNNTSMNAVRIAPVTTLANLVRSEGAAG
jgi:hypothetical protein